jgi:hypothetical protein
VWGSLCGEGLEKEQLLDNEQEAFFFILYICCVMYLPVKEELNIGHYVFLF